ncbi:Wzz/FepE/Etk N-terminal domain-containing protein [Hymenobacter saemangeumensis]|uniref:Wzz/FepE/Etk N-terminal domain-containing protein n=1 Tax=Hymenobacter saemangeumensis TaxID=1084522 RepID=A0ABP8IA35_9BACT
MVLAAVVSIVVALLLPNIYKSTSVFFPTNPQTADPDRLLGNNENKLELGGRAEDLDRAITIGESQPVADFIIRKYNLYNHYGAGTPGDDAADNYVLHEFNSNLNIVHNERDAIELTFMDQDKFLAAKIANSMVEAIDSVNQQLTMENRRKLLGLYSQRYDSLKAGFERSRRQLIAARNRYGIFGFEMQGRYMVKQLIETEAALRKAEASGGDVAGLRRALRGLTKADGGNLINVESYVRGADSLTMFTSRVNNLQTRLIEAQAAYETARLGLTGRVSSVYVVQKAYPATKKTKPVRWLIVVGSVLLTFSLSVVVITLLELYRYNQRQPQGGLS